MPRYRKKPKIIDAFQMTLERRWDNSEWPMWMHEAWNREPGEGCIWIDPKAPIAEGHKSAAELVCGTLEGVCHISWGDYIIQGIQGEIYPCKPDIFADSYESVEESKYKTGEIADATFDKLMDIKEGEPIPDSLPTTKRLMEKPHAEIGFEVVGNKIVERWNVPDSFSDESGLQGLSDVARCKSLEEAERLCDLLNRGKLVDEATKMARQSYRDELIYYQKAASLLWQMLDNVDTLDDSCKSNEEAYRKAVRCEVQKRFRILVSDGYRLFPVTPEGVDPEPVPELK